MRPFLAGIFCLAAAVGGRSIPANAAVIASCGPMEGYVYLDRGTGFPPDPNPPRWTEKVSLDVHITFTGSDRVEDIVLRSQESGEGWTRSASDYGAPVYEVFRSEYARQVLVLWGPITEVYALDAEHNTVRLVSQKIGLVNSASAFGGACEPVGRER